MSCTLNAESVKTPEPQKTRRNALRVAIGTPGVRIDPAIGTVDIACRALASDAEFIQVTRRMPLFNRIEKTKTRAARTAVFGCLLMALTQTTPAQSERERFEFEHDGLTYVGTTDQPEKDSTRGLIVLIPGHGRTDVVEGGQLGGLRNRFNAWGWSTAMWDRAGCGESEGDYDHHQPVQDSAREAIAAIESLRSVGVPGSDRIGFWSLSRGGWIAPMAMGLDHDIDFWISVSGSSQFSNFPYMLETNIRLDGRSAEEAARMKSLLIESMEMLQDVSVGYERYLDRTRELYADPWYRQLVDGPPDRDQFEEWQQEALADPKTFHPETGEPLSAPEFESLLGSLDVSVLAVFGDKDTQVDWHRTRELYRSTLGRNPDADLEIRVLESCNHNMRKARTGAFREDLSGGDLGGICQGFVAGMRRWLSEL
jgi:pimeloyl-ACP methyl ester carboxylesterase